MIVTEENGTVFVRVRKAEPTRDDVPVPDPVPCDDYDDAVVRRWLVLRRGVQVPCEAQAVAVVRIVCRCGGCCPEHDGPNQMALCDDHLQELVADAGAGSVDILDVIPIGGRS